MLGSPGRTLLYIVFFNMAVVVFATIAYMGAGWTLADAGYMVLLTIYSVGYNEVHPVNTDYLHIVTIVTIILGCTGMILFTGALVQFLTIAQIQQIFGGTRMKSEVKKLHEHVIVVGFGRIGLMLAKELKASGTQFIIVELNEHRAEEVRQLGYLCLTGDATNEATLTQAGISRARALATVLPDDAANVFITLSARALNPEIEIIARGELPSTESKLIHAGANRVVLPAHIGAERIAEIILYPQASQNMRSNAEMQALEHSLHGLGLEIEVVIVPNQGPLTNRSIEYIESQSGGQFFIVQVNLQSGEVVRVVDRTMTVHGGDGLVIVGRDAVSARTLFEAPLQQAG